MNVEDNDDAQDKIENHWYPGTDSIPYDIIKYWCTEVMMEQPKLFEEIIRHGNIQEEWRTSITIIMAMKERTKASRIIEL